MDVNTISEQDHQSDEEQKVPLLRDIPTVDRNPIQAAISQTFQSTAHLANLLPTGTVMAFQLLAPVFTNQGECDPVSRTMTSILIALCGLSSFLLSFTDCFKDNDGKIYYGFATFNGLWVIDGPATIPSQLASKYRLRFIDFLHAFMSVLVFAAIALFDKNTVQCFYPTPSKETQEILTALPVGIGVLCSMLFVAFPTQRHGIGFPVTAN
ncbi:uncharacterized protein LOC110693674 [Chenopodium quinoa]|uniref:Uncharacterized protein n=1 Tax=Chenopodium quinoa TaxID=63459 RepID=A0A803LLM2_CHEQI|nr:uncharacterized protein LOC110693674 [Chenopodium quinoa]